jgi:hypothetical protein
VRKYIYIMCSYSNIIVGSLFWGYFCVILLLYLLDVKINIYLSFLFFFLLGFWIGNYFSQVALKKLKEKY